MTAAGLAAAVAASVAAAPPGPIGVAVSGGGDSVALLLLLHRHGGRPLAAVTIDHGLRPESAGEAAAVAALCARLGVPHAVRRWDGAGAGNLQMRAREARRALIADWAREAGVGTVALGHTLDDQAETFLLRLARGSGVDGLAAMAPVAVFDGIVWLRPLLGARRAALRSWLAAEGVGWADDPGNDDPRFDRVRARAALPLLAPLGLGAERLAATAAAMARARAALEAATTELARSSLTAGAAGDVELAADALAGAPAELALRLLAGALCWVSGARYRPRLARLEAALAAVVAGRLGHGLTLHGCILSGAARPCRDPSRAGTGGAAGAARRRGMGRAVAPRRAARGGGGGPDDRRARGRADWRACRTGAPRASPARRCSRHRRCGVARRSSRRHWRGRASGYAFRRTSPLTPPWGAGDNALNPPVQSLC